MPLTKNEKKLLGEFYEERDKVIKKNCEEDREARLGFNSTRSALERVECLVDKYLAQGIRLNSLCNNHEHTVSELVFEEILTILSRIIVITSANCRNDNRISDCPGENGLDDQGNIEAVVKIVRKLFLSGGRVKLDPHNDDDDSHERFFRIVSEYKPEFVSECKQIYDKLKSTAFEGIVSA